MRYKNYDIKSYIDNNEEEALLKASKILNDEKNMQSLNGIIGGKNKTYGLKNMKEYNSPEEYIEAWMKAHREIYNKEKELDPTNKKSAYRIQKLLEDDELKVFIEYFLARTYFRETNMN